jgi:DNA-binding response OmpR family regulator
VRKFEDLRMAIDKGPSSAILVTVNVLIIEDDELIGATLVSSLKRAGMRTKWATNVTDGLVLKRSFQPDVVLVDLNLPDSEGIGLVAALARDVDCGIIIVSGMIDEADHVGGLEIGVDDYIAKPPQLRELLALIRSVYRGVKARTIIKEDLFSRGVVKVGSFSVNFASRILHAEH